MAGLQNCRKELQEGIAEGRRLKAEEKRHDAGRKDAGN
jgi:hypothetical protein